MKILKATVVRCRGGTDTLMLWTDLPSPLPKVSTQGACLYVDCEHGTGEAYARRNFPEITEILLVES
jgi:hypothetical protein